MLYAGEQWYAKLMRRQTYRSSRNKGRTLNIWRTVIYGFDGVMPVIDALIDRPRSTSIPCKQQERQGKNRADNNNRGND